MAAGMLPELIEALLRRREGRLSELLPYPVDPGTLSSTISMLPGVRLEGDRYVVVDPLDLAIYAMRRGVYYRRVAPHLHWRDFEKAASKILAAHGYVVYHSVMATRPRRFEIDVLGIDMAARRAIVIDCKHWRHGLSPSMIIEVGRRHIERTRKLLRYREWLRSRYPLVPRIEEAVPVIVTLNTPRIRKVDDRAIVIGFHELNNFLADLHLVLDTLGVKPMRPGDDESILDWD